MMLDPGLNNFASIADNKGNVPIVIKGGAIKACNQWFNKRMAFLRSEQMKGHDPKIYRPPVTRQMERISRKREAFLRDTFYKYAHYICRLMEERGLSHLIIGYNKGQKQGINLKKKNNQSFVQVPFAKFRRILKVVGAAANTGRKYDGRIFPEGMDCGYLYGTVRAVTYKDVLRKSLRNNRSNPGQTGQRACVCPVSA